MSGPLPEWLAACVAATVFLVMFNLGLAFTVRDLREAWRTPGPLARGLLAVVVAVPLVALAVVRLFELPRLTEIGIVLMAISPGAPVALRRSLQAGGHQAFAPSLQLVVVSLAVVTLPLSLALLNRLYGGHAALDPLAVARQVTVAQLAPIALGMALRRSLPGAADRIAPVAAKLAGLLLVAAIAAVLATAGPSTLHAGGRPLLAIAAVTIGALAVGHAMGGADPTVRTALAFSCAARNPGLALLVATQNNAPPAVIASILAYLLVSVLTIVPYELWRRRVAPRAAPP
jgi:BASS family bile acid:Na+ symporter